MAKSLFGGNNGGNLQDKYRAQNDAAIKRERADELDGKIRELSEAKFKGKRFNKYYVYVCDGKGKKRKFYLNEKPLEYVLAEYNDDTSKNKNDTLENTDDALAKVIDAFASIFAATKKLSDKFSVLGIRPMIILDLSE